MALFEIEANGKSYEIEAPDMDTALSAISSYKPANAAPETPAPPKKQAEARAYEPTWREKIAQFLMGDSKPSPERERLVKGVTGTSGLPGSEQIGAIDFTPARIPLFAQEAKRDIDAGNYGGAAIDALGATPVPFLNKGVEAVVSGANKIGNAVRASTPRDELLEAAGRRGIEIPRAVASDSLTTQRGAAFLKELPGVGAPIVKKSQAALKALDDDILGLADNLGGATPQEAGQAIHSDVVDWMKQGSRSEAREIYKDVDALMLDAGGKLTKTKEAIQDIVNVADEAKLNAPSIVKTLRAAVDSPEGLSYDGAQALRTHIGDMMSGKIAPEPGMDARALDRIYAALSEDLRDMASAAGAAGVAKKNAKKGAAKGTEIWDTANARFQTEIAKKRADLEKIIGKTGEMAPEAIASRLVTMASSKGGADLGRLEQALSVMSPQTRDDLAASIIAHMGRDKDGLSGAKFRTAYEGNLSERGRALLFPNKDLRQALDDISTVAKAFERLARMGNPSGTGQIVFGLSGISGAMAAPLPVISAAVGGHILARLLASPASARKVASYSRAALAAVETPSQRTQLALVNAAQELAREISGQTGEPPEAIAKRLVPQQGSDPRARLLQSMGAR